MDIENAFPAQTPVEMYTPMRRCHDVYHGVACEFLAAHQKDMEDHETYDYHWASGTIDGEDWAMEWDEYDRKTGRGGNFRVVASKMIRRSTGPGEEDWVYIISASDFTDEERMVLELHELHVAFESLSRAAQSLRGIAENLLVQIETIKSKVPFDELG